MVRRSERALGQAIRRGQEEGTIGKRGLRTVPDYERGGRMVRGGVVRDPEITSPSDYFSNNSDTTEVYAVTDNVTDAEFEEALDRAQEACTRWKADTNASVSLAVDTRRGHRCVYAAGLLQLGCGA